MAISMNQVLTGRCDLTRCGLHKPPLRPGWSINATVFQQHGAQSSVRNRLPPKRSRSRRHILEPSPTWCPRRPSILEPLPDDTFPWLWDNNRCSPLYYAARAAYFYSHPNRAFNNAKAVSIMFRGKEYCLKYSNSIPKSSERVQRSRVIHSTSSGKTREIARREGTDYNAALRRTRKRHLTSSSM